MKIPKHTAPALLACAALAFFAAAPGTAKEVPVTTPAPYSNAFAVKFYRHLAAPGGNVFFSPYGIASVFAMTREGAAGATAEEYSGVFSFPAPDKGLAADFAAAAAALEKSGKKGGLVVANGIWPQKDYKFVPAYLSLLKKSYGAESAPADFRRDPEAERRRVNAWAAKKTGGRIKDLFPPDSFNPLTRLVLANAVYFKGAWEHPFDKDLTADADFFTGAGAPPLKVKMMSHPGRKPRFYASGPEAVLVELPYAGGTLSMTAIMPAEGRTLAELERDLTPEKLAEWRGAMKRKEVKVFLPRLKFSGSYDLAEKLRALGLNLAFTNAADFSGMDGTRELYIQKALHKAFVELNEEGTEAAAATGAAMGLKSMPFFEVFRADRPFLFLITENTTGLILFMGRVERP